MIKTNSNEIVRILSDSLFNIDYSPLGMNKKRDKRGLYSSLQHFLTEWFFRWVENFEKEHPMGKVSSPYSEYLSVFQKLKRKNQALFKVVDRNKGKLLYVNETPRLVISLQRRGKGGILKMQEGQYRIEVSRHRELHLSAKQFYKIFSGIDKLLEQRRKFLIETGFKYTLPHAFQSDHKRAKLTKNMGHSTWGDGSFAYGLEYRLKMTDTHDFGIAHITDYFWQSPSINEFYQNICDAKTILMEVAHIVPDNVDFICSHRDDCGVDFTDEREYPDNYLAICYIMNRLKEVIDNGNNTICEKDYSELLNAADLECVLTVEAFKKQFHDGWAYREHVVKETREQLRDYCDLITIEPKWDCLNIYLLPNRNHVWTRECGMRIPYTTNMEFLSNIQFLLYKAAQLTELFDRNSDFETTVGLLTNGPEKTLE